MKEETNETATAWTPTEAEMNEMHGNAWLNFHADAQEAKQELSRRYAKMVNTFGSYKQMPDGVKEILKQDYAAHEAKWGENGEEQQKRFGVKADDPAKAQPEASKPEPEYRSLADEKEAFLNKLQQTREKSQTRSMEYER